MAKKEVNNDKVIAMLNRCGCMTRELATSGEKLIFKQSDFGQTNLATFLPDGASACDFLSKTSIEGRLAAIRADAKLSMERTSHDQRHREVVQFAKRFRLYPA